MAKYVLGNWKSHGTLASVQQFGLKFRECLAKETSVAIPGFAPPYHLIRELSGFALGQIGAQNVSAHANGAFTGEISASMLHDLGCGFCLVGHSERRQLFGESDGLIEEKLRRLFAEGIKPVLCVGETLAEREANQLERVLDRQLEVVKAFHETDWLIAYEPVWAIGTGRAATPEDAQSAHLYIKQRLAESGRERVSVLYGGSVKGSNAAELAAQTAVDGFLVGGASLDPVDFHKILRAFG